MYQIEQVFLREAYHEATKSPDRSTQNGAVIVRDGQIILRDYTHLPDGFEETDSRMLERPRKYAFSVHAERAIIFQAARKGISLAGTTMYVPWYACADCAQAIIQAGIKEVVGHAYMFDLTPTHPSWMQTIQDAFEMLSESDVITKLFIGPVFGPSIRFNGNMISP